MKCTLWGREVDLDLPDQAKFPTDDEIIAMDDLMPSCEHGWLENARGQQLHYRRYVPPDGGKIRAVLVYQHGIQGHSGIAYRLKSGRVTNFALLSAECLERGIALYTLDMAGHGFSEGTRFFIPNADWTTNRDDLDEFARFAASQHGDDLPLFLGGDSYGANLSINLAGLWQQQQPALLSPGREDDGAAAMGNHALGTKSGEVVPPQPPRGFAGFVVVAPAIIANMPPPPVTFALRRVLAPLLPKWAPFFMPHPVNPDAIWSDEEVRALQTSERQMEMCLQGGGKPFRLGTAAAMVAALAYAREVTIPELRVPFCVCHGTEDRSVPQAGTEYLLDRSKTEESDKVGRKEEGSYHDLLGEPTAEKTAAFMLDWIVERCRLCEEART